MPIVLGRHLIEAGHKPGPSFKGALDAAYDVQLEGEDDMSVLLAAAEKSL